jgi:molecular chaperone HtpG
MRGATGAEAKGVGETATDGTATGGTAGGTVERHEFGAEVGQLLDLVVHSLYSEREIFLRELVANAADAIDRRRFESLTDPALAPPAAPRVRVVPDKPGRTLSIEDDGIGMSHDELVSHLGTIARSGSRAFAQSARDTGPAASGELPSLIGQFGVGFYAAFMVAERVDVTSRRAGTDAAWTWSSDGRGSFTIAPATRETAGTTVALRLKADAEEFLEPARLDTVVRRWAEHITVPVVVVSDGREEAANEGAAVWRKPKAETTEAEAEALYRQLGNYFGKPWATLQWRAEGALEYFALLFIPDTKPMAAVEEERESRLRLHVKRMFITDRANLLPPWLRFVQGVVDTEDLPLNVSREMLQATPVLARIRRAVTNRVLTELKSAAKEPERYEVFWRNFGAVLKEGVWEDSEHRAELAPLLRFRSSAVPGLTALPDYVSRMKPEQKSIYYLTGDDADALARSAQLEGFRARGVEVLLLDSPIDAFWPERLDSFADKKLRNAARATDELDALPAETPEGDAPDVAPLLAALKAALGDAVSEVRATARLVDSAVVLSAAAAGPDLQMQRLLRRAGRTGYEAPPVLEVNPRHRLIASLAQRAGDAAAMETSAHLLLDLARIQDGEPPRDPSRFARQIEAVMLESPAAPAHAPEDDSSA